MDKNDIKMEHITIGNISNLLKISESTLRYYDEIDLFKPRYVDPINNYRYYHITQLYEINCILTWKELGYSLKEIKKLIEYKDVDLMIELYNKKESEIKSKIKHLKKISRDITEYKNSLEIFHKNNRTDNKNNISIKIISTKNVVYINNSSNFYFINYRKDLNSLLDIINKNHLKVKSMNHLSIIFFGYPFDLNNKTNLEYNIPLDANYIPNNTFIKEVKEYKCAYLYHYGSRHTLHNSYTKLKKWILDNYYKFNDTLILNLIIGSPITNDPNKFVAEIQIPI